jgi:hypothetical protein
VNVFSPVTAFTSVNGVTATRAGATRQFLTAGIRDYGTAVFYRYFTQY